MTVTHVIVIVCCSMTEVSRSSCLSAVVSDCARCWPVLTWSRDGHSVVHWTTLSTQLHHCTSARPLSTLVAGCCTHPGITLTAAVRWPLCQIDPVRGGRIHLTLH